MIRDDLTFGEEQIYCEAPQAFKLYFTLADTSIAYPYLDLVFSSKCAALVCSIIPLSTFLLSQFWLRSFRDLASAVLGLAYATVTGSCIQVILKKTIGGLRPNFLVVCQPKIPAEEGSKGVGFGGIYYSTDICTCNDKWRLMNAQESFPSGHAETAFAGLGFLTIYLAARLSIGSGGKGYWRMLMVVTPVLLATYLAATLVLGYHHRVGDVVFGALIGSLTAVMGYGIVFRSVWDSRLNTEPYLRERD